MTPIYLDNGATTFPKPHSVIKEVNFCISRYCGNAGRGSHPYAMESAMRIYECRKLLSDTFAVGAPERVNFTLNTTYAINLLLKGLLRQGDHVLISDIEHNSVWRPIYKLAKLGIIEYDVFPSMLGDEKATPVRICAGIAKKIKKNTRLVICNHSSNICSYHLPIEEIGAFCNRHKILFAVDAAQSAGHIPINMTKMHIDALCMPAHKGLYGIQGLGVLALSENIPLDTVIEGGNGFASLLGEMPDESPERFESGTMPTPAIVGLSEGLKIINRLGMEEIAEYERSLFRRLRDRLSTLPKIKIYAPQYEGAVLLFSHSDISSEALAMRLGEQGICLRDGHHCAALAHKTLGTGEDGALRASFGIFNTSYEVDKLVSALKEL